MTKKIYEVRRTQVSRVEADSDEDARQQADLLDRSDWTDVGPVLCMAEDPTAKEEPLLAEQDLKVTLVMRLRRYGDSDEEIEARIEDETNIINEAIDVISNILPGRFIDCHACAERLGDIRYPDYKETT